MKNFIKQNWFKLLIIFVVVYGFYWFQVRPSHIKEKCLSEAEFNPAMLNIIDSKEQFDFIDRYYGICLKRYGL